MTIGLLSPVIAVDGGGTRCRLVLDAPGVRHAVEAGPANVSTDFAAAVAEIAAGLQKLAERAGMSRDALLDMPAYLGLAGVADAAMAERVRAALPLRHARVEDDRRAALRGALGRRDGAIAHIGTGSFFALQSGGAIRLAGGWGWRLGDEASAYWVGRCALTETLAAVDGLTAPSALTGALLAEFGGPGGIVARAGPAAPPRAIADIARRVTAAAEAGDPVARRILGAGAAHIAEVLARMGWRAGMAFCLTGGGLRHAYRAHLPADLAAALAEPAESPIEGAVELARDWAGERAQ